MKNISIAKRKKDHLKFALSDAAQIGDPGFIRYNFIHNALPEIDYDEIDTSTQFLGKNVDYPFFISSMTGGVSKGIDINKNLALAAEKKGIAMGVGSQRVAIVHPEYRQQFEIRKYAPNVPIMANIGLVQLNYGFGLNEIKEIVKMSGADALIFHINPIQELIQPEGDRNFKDLLPKLAKIIEKIHVPVIVKEVGFGLSEDVVQRLYNVGVRIFDTAGWGGTSWAYVEGQRREGFSELGKLFSSWGIPTAESIRMCKNFKSNKERGEIVILGSGGVRTGIDIAKCLALGADLVGIAAPFGKAALESKEAVEKLTDKLGLELKISMMGVGVKNIEDVKCVPLTISDDLI